MSKRFTDTELWKKQRWFRKLSPTYKLVFCYIKDLCNHAGIWTIDCSDLVDDLGLEEFEISDFVAAINTEFDKISGVKIAKERVIVLENNMLWITGFVQFQYKNHGGLVNPESSPVRTALMVLEGLRIPPVTLAQPLHNCQNILEYALRVKHISLTKELVEGWKTPKDKDKDKDKRKGGVGEKRNGKPMRAVSIDRKKMTAEFSDGTSQSLGSGQRSLLEINELKPSDVFQGLIN
jgi:hypothetical protein